MRIIWNPFYKIKGPSYSPHAPTLRASFWRKMLSTFDVFEGSVSFDPNESHPLALGIIDYLTLGAGRLFYYGAYYLDKWVEETNIPRILKPVSTLLWMGLKAAQYAVALASFLTSVTITIALTFTILPIVHIVSFKMSFEDRQKALNVKGAGKTLGSWLKENNIGMDEVSFRWETKEASSNKAAEEASSDDETHDQDNQLQFRGNPYLVPDLMVPPESENTLPKFTVPKCVANLMKSNRYSHLPPSGGWKSFFRLDIGNYSDFIDSVKLSPQGNKP